jgi:hypothetical protein
MRQKNKPWEALGMSRATWFRHGKPDRKPDRPLTQEQMAKSKNMSVRGLRRPDAIRQAEPHLADLCEAGQLKPGTAERVINEKAADKLNAAARIRAARLRAIRRLNPDLADLCKKGEVKRDKKGELTLDTAEKVILHGWRDATCGAALIGCGTSAYVETLPGIWEPVRPEDDHYGTGIYRETSSGLEPMWPRYSCDSHGSRTGYSLRLEGGNFAFDTAEIKKTRRNYKALFARLEKRQEEKEKRQRARKR